MFTSFPFQIAGPNNAFLINCFSQTGECSEVTNNIKALKLQSTLT